LESLLHLFIRSQTSNAEWENLDENVKQQLKPFMCGRSPVSDKLNGTQRAYFRYFINTHQSDGVTDVVVSSLIAGGIKCGVWGKGWHPEGVNDFFCYVKDRMKNEKKRLKRLSLKASQDQRLGRFLDFMQDTSGMET